MSLFRLLLSTFIAFPYSAFAETDRVREATDLVLQLCLAKSSEIEITSRGDAVEVSGDDKSVVIEKESVGLVGGISKELTNLSSQQASEARACTQKYLKELFDIVLKDASAETPKDVDFYQNNAQFWGANGFWQDPSNYCKSLMGVIRASIEPRNFEFSDSGDRVSLKALSSKPQKISGNFFVRTEFGSRARFCSVFYNSKQKYNALACSRLISRGDAKSFAAVYSKTVSDTRTCLGANGWIETSLDKGVCMPNRDHGDCIHTFSKNGRFVWLFANFSGERYEAGIQMDLGD